VLLLVLGLAMGVLNPRIEVLACGALLAGIAGLRWLKLEVALPLFVFACFVFLLQDGIDRPDPERRAAIDRQLAAASGKHLVLIRRWSVLRREEGWIQNSSDVDSARVVWARDLGAIENEKLRAYYRDRTVWLLEPDARPPKLSAYEPPTPPPVAKPPEPAPAKPAAKKPLLQFEEVPRGR
jgi:hypothetical protein